MSGHQFDLKLKRTSGYAGGQLFQNNQQFQLNKKLIKVWSGQIKVQTKI